MSSRQCVYVVIKSGYGRKRDSESERDKFLSLSWAILHTWLTAWIHVSESQKFIHCWPWSHHSKATQPPGACSHTQQSPEGLARDRRTRAGQEQDATVGRTFFLSRTHSQREKVSLFRESVFCLLFLSSLSWREFLGKMNANGSGNSWQWGIKLPLTDTCPTQAAISASKDWGRAQALLLGAAQGHSQERPPKGLFPVLPLPGPGCARIQGG